MSVALPRDDDAAPVAQSLRIGFIVLRLAMLALAAYWATSNLRTVPPDSQAVSIRFGGIVGTRDSGLVLALPRPFEDVVLVPGPQRQLELRVDGGSPISAGAIDPAYRLAGDTPPETAALALTGDGGIVLLDATLFYRVTDPAAFYLAAQHVAPALRRLFLASAAELMARSSLNDVMVVQTGGAGADRGLQARREALRGVLVEQTNRRLAALAAAGASLGVTLSRTDVTAYLPPAAKYAFDAVLDATQMAEQGLATARTDAARAGQNASQESDRLIAEARAAADERVSVAATHLAALSAVLGDPSRRPSLIDQLYRERMAAILHAAGSVSTVDPATSHLLLPAGPP